MKFPNSARQTFGLILSLLMLASCLLAQSDERAVRRLPADLQQEVQFLNSEYLVFSPSVSSRAKFPLLIFLHGASGVVVDREYCDWLASPKRALSPQRSGISFRTAF